MTNKEEDFDEYFPVLDDFGCKAYEDLAKSIDEKVYRWIRVEAKEDESLTDIKTKEDVLSKIRQVREYQESFGPATLYKREWERRTRSDDKSTDSDGGQPVGSFSALQFNTLAEGLSAGPDVSPPFPIDQQIEGEKNIGYGGFSELTHPEICLDFSLRRWRLLEVILGGDSSSDGSFDLLALEEVDRFRGFFAPVLRLFGYEGIFAPKTKSPGVPLGYYSDGCALFWKTSVFELLSEERIQFKVGNQIIILAMLKHVESGVPLLVAATHLKAQKSESSEMIRCRQVKELLGHIEDALVKQTEMLDTDDIPIIVMGDFNADPPSDTPFSSSSVQRVIFNHKTTCDDNSDIKKARLARPMKFQSAHPIDPPNPNFFTTWKTRGSYTVKRIIDYIFYSEQLTCTDTLNVPELEEIESTKLPSLRYPSDHLMIAAKFEIRK